MTSSQDPNQPGQPGAPQPEWGSPPPAAPPAWGTQQPGYPPPPGYAPGWGPQGWAPPPPRSNRKGCVVGIVAALVVLGVIGALVASCALTLGPALMTGKSIQDHSGGRVTGVSYNWYNGVGTFSITVAAGIAPEEGRQIACEVVKPTLKGTQFEGTHFVIFDQTGYQLASDLTPCP